MLMTNTRNKDVTFEKFHFHKMKIVVIEDRKLQNKVIFF